MSCKLPSQVIDLKNWYLTLPIANDNGKEAKIIEQNELPNFQHPTYFHASNDVVIFNTFAGGFTTPNSKNTRCELREMQGTKLANWTTTKGKHTMEYKGSVVKVPFELPSVVIGQIHDDEDDVIEIRCWKPTQKDYFIIDVFHDSKIYGVLDSGYKIGHDYTIKIVASKGFVNVFYNDMQEAKLKIPCKKSGCYFKVGCYLQNSKKINPVEQAEVCLYDVNVKHE